MINEIDILHECYGCNFTRHTGKEVAGLFCIVSDHQKIVIELREYDFDSFSEPLIGPGRLTPVFLIQPIKKLKRNVGSFKEGLLDLGAEVPLVSKHPAIMIFPAHIIKIVEIMNTCSRHVIRMYDSAYSADGMELIAVVMYALRSAVSPVGSRIDIIAVHDASRPCVPADLYRFGVNTEYIRETINGGSNILADFFCKTGCQFTPGIELSSDDQGRQILPALMVQTMKEKIFTVEPENFGCNPERYEFEARKLGCNPSSVDISEFINTISGEILADSEDFYEICYEIAHKQCDST